MTEIKTVIQATSTQTVFGNEIVTIQGIASDSTKIEVVVNYDHQTKEIKLNDYQVIESATTSSEAVTEFRVDVLTGTKTTTTNDSTVIASSEITTALVKELHHQTHTELTV